MKNTPTALILAYAVALSMPLQAHFIERTTTYTYDATGVTAQCDVENSDRDVWVLPDGRLDDQEDGWTIRHQGDKAWLTEDAVVGGQDRFDVAFDYGWTAVTWNVSSGYVSNYEDIGRYDGGHPLEFALPNGQDVFVLPPLTRGERRQIRNCFNRQLLDTIQPQIVRTELLVKGDIDYLEQANHVKNCSTTNAPPHPSDGDVSEPFTEFEACWAYAAIAAYKLIGTYTEESAEWASNWAVAACARPDDPEWDELTGDNKNAWGITSQNYLGTGYTGSQVRYHLNKAAGQAFTVPCPSYSGASGMAHQISGTSPIARFGKKGTAVRDTSAIPTQGDTP